MVQDDQATIVITLMHHGLPVYHVIEAILGLNLTNIPYQYKNTWDRVHRPTDCGSINRSNYYLIYLNIKVSICYLTIQVIFLWVIQYQWKNDLKRAAKLLFNVQKR